MSLEIRGTAQEIGNLIENLMYRYAIHKTETDADGNSFIPIGDNRFKVTIEIF